MRSTCRLFPQVDVEVDWDYKKAKATFRLIDQRKWVDGLENGGPFCEGMHRND
jgi:hypothetical protein